MFLFLFLFLFFSNQRSTFLIHYQRGDMSLSLLFFEGDVSNMRPQIFWAKSVEDQGSSLWTSGAGRVIFFKGIISYFCSMVLWLDSFYLLKSNKNTWYIHGNIPNQCLQAVEPGFDLRHTSFYCTSLYRSTCFVFYKLKAGFSTSKKIKTLLR